MSDDEEAEVGDAEIEEAAFEACEQGDVLLDGEAAYVAEDERGVVDRPGAVLGGELDGVHPALHEMAGPVGGLLEHAAELFVGRIEDTREGVETSGSPERGGLDALFEARCRALRETMGEPVEPAGGVLVDVGVP